MKHLALCMMVLLLAGCNQATYEQNTKDTYISMGYTDVVVNNYYVYYTIPQENVRCREHINNYYANSCWKLGDKE